MSLSKDKMSRCVTAAKALRFDSPSIRVENMAANTLGLNAAQRLMAFPLPDPNATLDKLVAHLTKEREEILRTEGHIPSFVVDQDALGTYYISGTLTYLKSRGIPQLVQDRLRQHESVRRGIMDLTKGHDLEALAAALVNAACGTAQATQASADQGIDVVGWNTLLPLDPCFLSGAVHGSRAPFPGERVIVLASAKKVEGRNSARLSRAHIRELVGGWLIQRSNAGAWRSHGVSLLTPVQMLLVTTYQMSLDARAECHTLGIQVWNLPELVFLICKYAPAPVFDASKNHNFVRSAFRAWWSPFNKTRLVPAAALSPP